MTPEQLIQNAIALAQTLMPGGGTLAAIVGTLAYGYGKAADSPNAARWGKNAWIGAAVLFGGTAVIGLIQYVSLRLFGTPAAG
jgi:hypothetical protein